MMTSRASQEFLVNLRQFLVNPLTNHGFLMNFQTILKPFFGNSQPNLTKSQILGNSQQCLAINSQPILTQLLFLEFILKTFLVNFQTILTKFLDNSQKILTQFLVNPLSNPRQFQVKSSTSLRDKSQASLRQAFDKS